jgi:UPF0271 protein
MKPTGRPATRTIDVNVDAGESFGRWTLADEAALFEVASSVSLACGFHAGDPGTIRDAVALADAAGLAIGAHPGLPDLIGFGRRPIEMTPRQVYDDVLYQLGAVEAFMRARGRALAHAKMHGALSTVLGERPPIADAIVRAVADFDGDLPLIVPYGSELAAAARRAGHPAVREGFPDRAYTREGRIAPRHMAGASIEDPELSARKAVRMVVDGVVDALDGTVVPIEVESLCLHGDNPAAAEIARGMRDGLAAAGVTIARFEAPV